MKYQIIREIIYQEIIDIYEEDINKAYEKCYSIPVDSDRLEYLTMNVIEIKEILE